MKTKIVLSLAIAMVAMFTLSMIPKKINNPVKKLPPAFSCPYQVQNNRGCAIVISYEYVNATNNPMGCFGNATVNAGGNTVIPCCSGAANIYINVIKVNGSPVYQTPSSVSGPAGYGNIQSATVSTTCGGTFGVQWTAAMTTVN